MIKPKFDVLQALKEAGYTTYRMRQEKTLSEVTIQKLRSGIIPSIQALDTICTILDMQPGNIIKHVPDEK